MKIKEIAKYHNLDEGDFYRFLNQEPTIKVNMFTESIDDRIVDYAVDLFKRRDEIKEEREKIKEKKELSDDARAKALSSMLITSGFSFDGYTITKYSGYISGDDATQIPRSGLLFSHNGENLTNALVKIRIQAIKELKEAAYDLGCNAVIGVDFDYITLEPETVNIAGGTRYEPYVICVTANGNAVVIEKNND